MKLIVGLGNPGQQYEQTRHNIGFMAVDYLWAHVSTEKMKQKFESIYGDVTLAGEKYLFIKPQTFMNNSGNSIRKWVDFYQLTAADVFVFYDDMDIPFGDFRLKTGGSAGGHNGLKSLISNLGTQDFHRVRLGIDRQPGSTVNYVLGSFNKAQKEVLQNETFPKLQEFFDALTVTRFALLQNLYNQKKKVDKDE